jgi:5-formyltetrahydrofolate cyclo-ligase
MHKQELRELYKAKRKALSDKERLKLDDLMLLQFQQFDYGDIQTILSYWPITGMAEPNTHLFAGYLRHLLPGLRISYPVINPVTNEMKAVAITEDTVYDTNAMGITEPREGEEVPASEIDLVLVPMLVCDSKGFRVGYGKGYYDRFLSNCREDIVKTGISYFEPVDQITDSNQFDVPLTYCITPQQIYEF